MIAHQNGPFACPACEPKLNQCNRNLVVWFRFVRDQYPNAHVAWGFRNKLEQDQCVKEGKSHLPWPKSKHNQTDAYGPCSEAIDLFQQGPQCEYIANPRWFYSIAQAAEANGDPIKWGGSFHDPGDKDHFELITVSVSDPADG